MASTDVVLLTLQSSNDYLMTNDPILGNGQRVAVTEIDSAINSPLKMGNGVLTYSNLPFIETVNIETDVAYDLTQSFLAVDGNEVSITNTGSVAIAVSGVAVNPDRTVTFRRISGTWTAIYFNATGGIDAYDYFDNYLENEMVSFDENTYISKQGGNLGNPPKVDRVVTGAYQAYTNLVTDPTDLTTANWTNTNSTDEISTLSINGNLFTKIINSSASLGYNYQIFSGSFSSLILTGQVTIKKGFSNTNWTRFTIYNVLTTNNIFELRLDWDSFDSVPGIVVSGVLLDYNWIDSETLTINFKTDALVNLTDDVQVRCYASNNAIADEYTYFSEVQLIDSSSITMFPFVDGTHSADVINETFTMPDKFAVRLKIDPKFAYDTGITPHNMIFNVDNTHRFNCYFSSGNNFYQVRWSDGTNVARLSSQQFDDGSSLTDINQKLDIIIFANLSSGGINDSALIVIPQESGSINTDNLWVMDSGASPDVKSSTFPTLSIGYDAAINQADSDIEYLRIYDWDGVKPTITSSDDVDTYFIGQVPLFETNDENPKDWWSSWPRESVIEKDTDYTITDNDDSVFEVATGATDKTITLPTLATSVGMKIHIIKVDSGVGNMIVAGEGSETINGVASLTKTTQYDFVTLIAGITEWFAK